MLFAFTAFPNGGFFFLKREYTSYRDIHISRIERAVPRETGDLLENKAFALCEDRATGCGIRYPRRARSPLSAARDAARCDL